MATPMDERHTIATQDVRLDLRGLKCPLPALKTRAALARLSPQAILVVEATDPMAAIDIPHLVAETGDEMVEQNVGEAVLTFRIRKARSGPGRAPRSRVERRDNEN